MPKITALPEVATPADDDLLAVVDDSTTTTRRLTFANLRVWLQSLVDFVTTPMITDKAVTGDKMGEPIAFKAYGTTAQTPTAATWTKVNLDVVPYDYGGNFDNTTMKFTAPYDGIYNFAWKVGTSSSNQRIISRLYKNTTVETLRGNDIDTIQRSSNGSGDVLLSAGETIELNVYTDTGAALVTTLYYGRFLTGHLVGRLD